MADWLLELELDYELILKLICSAMVLLPRLAVEVEDKVPHVQLDEDEPGMAEQQGKPLEARAMDMAWGLGILY